ncbi:MAG: hypothetical protein JEY94_01525 [Melioribacteraceae bacterium]|nr:hypothetical protein [Melioribacteraceae bacterium]
MKIISISLLTFFLLVGCTANQIKNVNPVNPNSSKEAKELLKYLYDLTGTGVLSGQHNYPHQRHLSTDSVISRTGKTPAIWGCDFIAPNIYREKYSRQDVVDEAIRQYRKGCIITLMYHQVKPFDHDSLGFSGSVKSHVTDDEWKEIITPGTNYYNMLIEKIDSVAVYLKQLEEKNIPVLWRPYHEMNGIWFWYGDRKGSEGFIKLWKIMYDRYVNFHKLNNLIWVWNANAPRDWKDDEAYDYKLFYPGDEYVDVLAADVYKNDFKKSHHDQLLELGNGKPIAIGECGIIPAPEILEEQTKWVWFMDWANFIWEYNEPEKVRELYNSPRVINLNDINIGLKKTNELNKRFFSEYSFWNQPLPENPEVDPKSEYWIGLLEKDQSGENFGPNVGGYSIPIYEVDSETPKYRVNERVFTDKQWAVVGFEGGWFDKGEVFHHSNDFEKIVPIPEKAIPDKESDAHFALVDYKNRLAWDMWGAEFKDGQWFSYTGMFYSIDDDGVFDEYNFPIKDDESIHHYGPGRASGVPIIAGTIMYDEVKSGVIEHKLSCAVRYGALKEFTYPAIWTDGVFEGGLPEGSVIQLDPELDLTQFNLTEGEKVVAKAMQKYGLVITDVSLGNVIYPEGLWNNDNKSWEGILRGWSEKGGIKTIPLKNYRVLKVVNIVNKGDNARPKFDHVF